MKPKILVVDPVKSLRNILCQLIQSMGYDVLEASSGAEAIRSYQNNYPILTTMDLNMPDMNGVDIIRKIKEFDPEANIMMCSALEQRSMIIEGIHAGAKEFVSKPFHENNMKETMRKLLLV
ncbi:response regulator [Paenibacillus marchantiophytorum]|uniref:Response regulator n=1 Tax=Paenibacillus marchantiophytorum TaxID=1619310 RepID=A0ABQ2BT16_9BACL|nr:MULTISPECIES: response regulator [Paenibacillus]UKS25294.1 response regulator [Paenibacillus sp. HWE-109]GGI46879.1 response regulator [Paenibacillus marchantiophytorum]